MPVSPPGATQEQGVVGIVGRESYSGRVYIALRCQVGIRACQLAYPYNYPPITAQLAANELINATDTSYQTALARVCCDSSSFRCQIQIKLLMCCKTMRQCVKLVMPLPMINVIRKLHKFENDYSFSGI